jgi:dTDP-4-dehydrorhamnose 3,5-epimerase-like enzyme
VNTGLAALHSVTSVVLTDLPRHSAANGDVVVMERVSHIPFVIVRVFVVIAPAGAVRGQHAHKQCTQFLTCPTGCVEIVCDDGLEKATYVLNQPGRGLLIPPSIWAQQIYRETHSVLTVLCDRPYEAEDYIREYPQFLAYRMVSRETAKEQG